MKIKTDYTDHLRLAGGNHVAAAILTISDEMWLKGDDFIRAIERISESIDSLAKAVNNIDMNH